MTGMFNNLGRYQNTAMANSPQNYVDAASGSIQRQPQAQPQVLGTQGHPNAEAQWQASLNKQYANKGQYPGAEGAQRRSLGTLNSQAQYLQRNPQMHQDYTNNPDMRYAVKDYLRDTAQVMGNEGRPNMFDPRYMSR